MTERARQWRAGGALGVFGGVLGVVLVAAIFYWMPLDLNALRALWVEINPWWLAGVVLSSMIHGYLTGQKWKLVTRYTTTDRELGAGYYFYSCLIALLGQVMPLQVAVMTGRSLASKFHARVPLHRGAVGAAYDQIFDVLVPLVVLAPACLYFLGLVGLVQAAITAGLLTLFVGAAIFRFGERGLGLVIRGGQRMFPPLARFLPSTSGGRYASGWLMGTLFTYSVLRFGNLVFRACLVAWALGLEIDWIPMLFSCTVVTFALIFSFVPGGLGFLEWGWIGALQAFGLSEETAVHYALSSRLIIVGALVTINLLHGVVMGGYWFVLRGRGQDIEL